MCGTMSLLLLLSGIFEESGLCFAAAFDAVFFVFRPRFGCAQNTVFRPRGAYDAFTGGQIKRFEWRF